MLQIQQLYILKLILHGSIFRNSHNFASIDKRAIYSKILNPFKSILKGFAPLMAVAVAATERIERIRTSALSKNTWLRYCS